MPDASGARSFPLLQITRKTLLIIMKFRFLRRSGSARENKGEGITIRGTIDYESSPGEITKARGRPEELVDNGHLQKPT